MPPPLVIEPAPREEWSGAFRLMFQHAPADEREARVANARRLARSGELDPRGILVARRGGGGLRGAMLCLPIAGASGLVWPPQALEGNAREQVEDALVGYATTWLRQQGAKLGQALLVPEEARLAAPLQRNGFRHITRLAYLRHDLSGSFGAPPSLQFSPYDAVSAPIFQRTLLRTYERTLDCPEVNGVRDIHEVMAGHRAQGLHDPTRWWLATEGGNPVGVLLLAQMPEWDGWDLSYLGVVPEARRRGVGRELARKALAEARAAQAAQLTLAVDNRNRPACNLYTGLGFQTYDQREVFLATWNG